MTSNKKTIYILLSRSGTWFSRLIHFATADQYTHASIGLDGPLGAFYSFARKQPQFALPAGLVEEQIRWGQIPSQRPSPCCLYGLTVDEEVYDRLREQLDEMYLRRNEYYYSILGTLACWFNLPLQRQHHYFCSQFVAALLQDSGAITLPKSAALVRPADFCQIKNLLPLHTGELGGMPATVVA